MYINTHYCAFCFRAKSCRTITFQQFNDALDELALQKFKDHEKEEAICMMHKLVEGKSPVIAGVTVRCCDLHKISSAYILFLVLMVNKKMNLPTTTVYVVTENTVYWPGILLIDVLQMLIEL